MQQFYLSKYVICVVYQNQDQSTVGF